MNETINRKGSDSMEPLADTATEPIALDLTPEIMREVDKLPVYPLAVRSGVGDALVSLGLGVGLEDAAKMHGVDVKSLKKYRVQYRETIERVSRLRDAVHMHYVDDTTTKILQMCRRSVDKWMEDGATMKMSNIPQIIGLLSMLVKYSESRRGGVKDDQSVNKPKRVSPVDARGGATVDGECDDVVMPPVVGDDGGRGQREDA